MGGMGAIPSPRAPTTALSGCIAVRRPNQPFQPIDFAPEGKMTHAATVMGVTVFAGAVTTFCSALFMAACQLTFFTDMTILIGGACTHASTPRPRCCGSLLLTRAWT